MDDIIMYSRSPKECIGVDRCVLKLLNSVRVILTFMNCESFIKTIDCLGRVMRPKNIYDTSHTLEAVCGLQSQTKLTEFRSFLVLYIDSLDSFKLPAYRKHLNRKPCNRYLPTFERLSDGKVSTIDTLENALSSSPILALENAIGHKTLDTDICDLQAESIVLQP